MGKILTFIVSAGMLYFMTAPGHAQTSSQFQMDYTREGAWRFSTVRETPYQTNGRVILRQLSALGKRLNQLSVVEPAIYVQLQGELHGYLQRLEHDSVDYGQTDVYHSVLLRLMQFDEQIKESLVENRQARQAIPIQSDLLPEGKHATVRPYALLFRRPDYRSKLVHILTHQNVTILKPGAPYCLVQADSYQGYLHTGMILHLTP